jgi:archaellum component FlaC
MNRKTLSILLTTLMLLNIALIAVIPFLPVVNAARGNPWLAATAIDLTTGNATGIKVANFNISVKAGDSIVKKIDGVSLNVTYYLTIVFAVNGSWIVSFDGAQFDLYMSKDGYSAISPGDVKYAGPFYVMDFYRKGLKKVTIANPYLKGGKADFYIGNITVGTTFYYVVIGPIPFDITADYKYIKVFDGIASQVAVTKATVEILPSIALTPTWGPGGRMVTLIGVALKPNEVLNITYGDKPNVDVIAQVETDDKGKFSYTWSIKDLKKDWSGTGTIPPDYVTINVWYNKTGTFIDYVVYKEYRRAFVQLYSVKKGDVALSFTSVYTGAGNATLTVNAYVFDTIVLAGAWWNPRYSVEVYVGGKKVASALPNETQGFFNVTFTVPELPTGSNVAEVRNGGVRYIFWIYILPTLILIPDKGYVGDTVQAFVYGFPANSLVRIYWDAICVDTELKRNVNIVNGTTGPDGKFNVTVTFKVPRTYGGSHNVTAVATDGTNASATFTVLPRVRVEAPTQIAGIPAFNATYGQVINVVGEALDPTVWYSVAIDNSYLGNLTCDACGYGVAKIVGAGFRPGLHSAALYIKGYASNLAVYTLFYVTPEGDVLTIFASTLGTMLTAIETEVSAIKSLVESSNAMLVDIRDGVARIRTDVGTIMVNVDAIRKIVENSNAVLAEVKGDVAEIKTEVGTIKARITALEPAIMRIDDSVATIKTNIGTISANVSALKPVVTEIRDGVATVKTTVGEIRGTIITIDGNVAKILTDVGTVKADVSAIKSGVEDVKGGVSTVTTIVIVAVILSVIAAATSIYSVIALRRALVK